MTKHHAQCQCGQLSAECENSPDYIVACNCQACQHRTGSPFGAALYFQQKDVSLTGDRREWSRTTDSGRTVTTMFCPTCGSSVAWLLDLRPDHMGVAYGCFTTPVPEPNRVVWTEEQHAWVSFPETWTALEKGSSS